MTTTTGTIDEVGAFVTTLLSTPAHRLTNCAGWTVHELIAHLAAGAAEEADLIEEHLAGAPERATRGFDEREQPLRDAPDRDVRDRFAIEGARLTGAIARLGNDVVLFTGMPM